MDSVHRKRLRSAEDTPFVPQSKYYINQQMFDARNVEKIREIHEKTVNLLFAGANNIQNNNLDIAKSNYATGGKVRLFGNGTIEFEGNQKPLGFPQTRFESKCCKKTALINSECRNCNLCVCEFCAYSCIHCSDFLCGACASLFGCGSIDSPCCDYCKMFS